MKEIEVHAGERIDLALGRLVAEAPAFMVFNDTRVEAAPGETVQTVYERWCSRRPEPKSPTAIAIEKIREDERQRIVTYMRQRGANDPRTLMLASEIEHGSHTASQPGGEAKP